MTSEEMNRAIEFIIEHQARFTVQLEDLARAQRRDREWAKRILARMDREHQEHAERIKEHAERMKSWEDFARQDREWRQYFERTMEKRHEEYLARLDRIIDKLSDREN